MKFEMYDETRRDMPIKLALFEPVVTLKSGCAIAKQIYMCCPTRPMSAQSPSVI